MVYDAPSEPEQQPIDIQQRVEGSQNQVIGQVSGGTVIGTYYQAPTYPSISAEIKARPLNLRSPYMGLRKYEVRDKDLFFGRDLLISQLLERLEEYPFLLVLGASGSGKSSLIRAGLIPKLREQLGAGFRELIFTPDRNSFDSLRSCLRSAGFRQDELASLESGSPEGMLQTIQAIKPGDEDWLILVDQFEELFTLCQDQQRRQAVIEGLFQLVQAELTGVQLVAAMRADFLDRLGAYPQLSDILKQSKLITDMGSDELRLAIEQPAAHHGVVLEPELTEAIIHDLKGQPSTASAAERVSLPLLQYTLKLLWENSDLSDRTLRLSTYRQLGGVRGALERHMDEIYSALPDPQKQAAKHIFLQLVDTISADAGATAVGKAVSRRAPLSEFNPTERQVLYQLIDKGLLVSDAPRVQVNLSSGDRTLADYNPTVELAHETLIDAWQPLKQWIEESRPLIRLNNQLKDDATRWYEIYQKDPTEAEKELWQGRRLQYLLSQRQEMESRFGIFKPEETQFIQACEELSNRMQQQALEQERRLRKEAEARANAEKREKRIAFIAGIFGFIILGLGILQQQRYIQINQQKAITVGALVGKADELFKNHNELESLEASVEALVRLRELGKDNTLELEKLQNIVHSVREINRFSKHKGAVYALAFSPDGNMLASAGSDGYIQLWDIYKNTILRTSKKHQDIVRAIKFNKDGELIASSSSDGTVILWDKSGNYKHEFRHGSEPVYDVSFSPDNKHIASSSKDTIKIWDINKPWKDALILEQNLFSKGKEYRIYGIDFHPINSAVLLSTGYKDNSAFIWDINKKKVVREIGKGKNTSMNTRFSKDGTFFFSLEKNSLIKIWDLSGKLIGEIRDVDIPVVDAELSSNSDFIASASANGTIKLWNIREVLQEWKNSRKMTLKPNEVIALSTGVNSIIFQPKGSETKSSELILASGNFDATIRLWKTLLNDINSTSLHKEASLLKEACLKLENYLEFRKKQEGSIDRDNTMYDSSSKHISLLTCKGVL